ncbi:MAG: DUF3737 family protein [Oscillospiraceae bacterium]|nr:DUF3737 family protein [Oscillospiraceae bacterium]
MIIDGKTFDEERALYGLDGAGVRNCRFDGPADGESAMKECRNLSVENCYFNLRYPFWHVSGATIRDSEMTDKCRAALWYDEDITIENCRMDGIKALRECSNIMLRDTQVVSPEFLWRCHDVRIESSSLESEYPMFECKDMAISGLTLKGKYSFQYVENAVIRDSVMDTKDAFWHSKNVTVYDSVIKGEYLAWYSENLRLVRCRIIGTQPLCYCKGLILEDCTMEGTDLSFERSEVNAKVHGSIDSIKNPSSGRICADSIGQIIMDPEYTNAQLVEICCSFSDLHSI